MGQILKEFSTDEVAHILLACGVHWRVKNEASNVPGTQIPWSGLIRQSVIFPYLDNCYIFPFSLIWRVSMSPGTTSLKEQIEARCAELVPNLDVRDLYISYDKICGWDNYKLGIGYETLFASSLAVKYFLRSIPSKEGGYFALSEIYDLHPSEMSALKLLGEYKVNFSQGIFLPFREVCTNFSDLGLAVVHNRNIQNAHHDLILPARTIKGPVNIAVQAKASFYEASSKDIMSQLKVSSQSVENVQQLFWLYLGEKRGVEKNFSSVLYLDGSGCCNGLALDSIILVKKLKSENQI
jgi:hypothetical protein